MRTRSIWPDRRQPIAVIGHVAPDPQPHGPASFDQDSLDRPTILRRLIAADVRDHHLATIRASMLCLGLHEEQVERVADEIEAMVEEGER